MAREDSVEGFGKVIAVPRPSWDSELGFLPENSCYDLKTLERLSVGHHWWQRMVQISLKTKTEACYILFI